MRLVPHIRDDTHMVAVVHKIVVHGLTKSKINLNLNCYCQYAFIGIIVLASLLYETVLCHTFYIYSVYKCGSRILPCHW